MKIKNIMVLMAVAGMAGGCSSIDEQQTLKTPVPIQLTASVGMETVTRGADGKVIETDATMTRGIQENALASGEMVYVWAKEYGSVSWDYLKAWTLTNGSTGLSGSTKYYPPDGTTITMNAVHGNFSTEPSEDNTAIGTLTHSVVADQSAAGNYEKSDLLFGTATGSKASTSAENIDFTHMLSKIEVNLTAGYGYDATDLETAEVHLNNVLPTVTIDPTDGTLGSASGTAVTITPRKDATTGTYEAVIPPQTFANPDALIAVTTTKEGLTLTSTVPNDVTTYASDTRYVYNVKVTSTWPYEGVQIGDVLNDDGTITAKANAPDYSKTPIGVIVYLAQSDNDPICEGLHALVMAVNECGTNYSWGPSGDIEDPNYFPHISSLSDARNELHTGLEKTLFALGDGHDHPAFVAARNHTADCSQFIGNTGWFLPNLIQLVTAAANIYGNTVESTTWEAWQYNNKSMHDAFENFLSKAGTGRYTTFPRTTGASKNHTIISSSIGRPDYSDPNYPSNKDFGTWIHFDGRSNLGIDIQTYSGTPRTQAFFCVFAFMAF